MFAIIVTGIVLGLISFLLILVVILQNPKDEGGNILASNNSMKQLVGAAEMPHLLHKVTYGLFILLVLFTLLMSYLLGIAYAQEA